MRNNPDFNSIEFDGIKKQAGLNGFSLTPKRWIAETDVIQRLPDPLAFSDYW